MVLELVFWVSVVGATFSYFIYPLTLARLPRRPIRRGFESEDALPAVSVIITAYNEEGRIRDKLRNTLDLDYPRERAEILVASDASSDGTDAVVAEFAADGVRLVRAAERLGKENAQRLAISEARGDVIVFSDVGTRLAPDSVRTMVRSFADPRVGAVSSEDRFLGLDGQPVGEGAYVRYEMWLRRLESSVNSLVGLSGSFFAVRRPLCGDWDVNAPSDFNSALSSVLHGYVAVSDPEVHGYYPSVRDERDEYPRKVRTVIRGMMAIERKPFVLDPRRVGLFAYQVWAHKVMRWAVPWFLLLLLAVSIPLASQHWFYATSLVGQIAFYATAAFAWRLPALRRFGPARLACFFVQANLAIADAVLRFMSGVRMVTWQPSRR
jgi:glycosyltransferase involved in cell wall biosynthesis